MKKIAIGCLCALLLAACSGPSKKEIKEQNDSLRIALQEQEASMNEMMEIIATVQQGFDAIGQAEGRIKAADGSDRKSAKENIKEDMQFIAQTIQSNKEQIEKLTKQLADSKYNGAQLKKTIERLTQQLAEKTEQLNLLIAELDNKNLHIAELDATVEELNKNVKSLTDTQKANEEQIAVQDREINRAWYVFGTKRELKEQKILEGSEVLQNKNFNQDYFTSIDIRKFNRLEFNSKSAKLLTTHPDGSYKLEKNEKKEYVLVITSPEDFWSVSRYLVVLTK